MVLMEAMAMGLPVVTTRHSGIPELVTDPDHGRLVAERDPEALVDAVMQLRAVESQWPAMGDAARATIEASFDQRRLNERLATMLRDLAAGRGASRG